MISFIVVPLVVIFMLIVQLIFGYEHFGYVNFIFIGAWILVYLKRLDMAYLFTVITSLILEIVWFDSIGVMGLSFSIAIFIVIILSERFPVIRRDNTLDLSLSGLVATNLVYFVLKFALDGMFSLWVIPGIVISLIIFFALVRTLPISHSKKLI